MTAAAIIVAAGSSTRLGIGRKKEYIQLKGKPVINHTYKTFACSGLIQYICIVVPSSGIEEAKNVMKPVLTGRPGKQTAAEDIEVFFAEGGSTRQQSVYNGLRMLEPASPDYVLIHDGARPWITENCIAEVLEQTVRHGGCVPAVVPADAVKRIGDDGFIIEHLARNTTLAVQTPQGFTYNEILQAHEKALTDGRTYIDDTEIYCRYIHAVFTIPGDVSNRKITYLHDIEAGE